MAPETRGAQFRSAGTAESERSFSSTQKGIFRKEGEYWTVGYSGNPFRLKDTKGLGYIVHLLRHPTVEFHVLDLFGGIGGQREDDDSNHSVQGLPRGAEDLDKAGIHITGLGDAGEMLDDQAKVAYRRRLSELREVLDEAKEFGNVERAEHSGSGDRRTDEGAIARRWNRRAKSPGSISFGTGPADHHQGYQIGSRKNCAQRPTARGYPVAMHQDGNLLLLPT